MKNFLIYVLAHLRNLRMCNRGMNLTVCRFVFCKHYKQVFLAHLWWKIQSVRTDPKIKYCLIKCVIRKIGYTCMQVRCEAEKSLEVPGDPVCGGQVAAVGSQLRPLERDRVTQVAGQAAHETPVLCLVLPHFFRSVLLRLFLSDSVSLWSGFAFSAHVEF